MDFHSTESSEKLGRGEAAELRIRKPDNFHLRRNRLISSPRKIWRGRTRFGGPGNGGILEFEDP